MVLPLYYNWRNLLARKLSTGLTFLVVGVVVFVLALLLSFAAGIRASLVASGHPENVLALKPGATSESTSVLSPDEMARLVQTPGVVRNEAARAGLAPGSLLLSPEVCVQTPIPRAGNGSAANVAVRGVDDVAFVVHPELRIASGRRFTQGALEAIVGQAAQERYTGLALGQTITLGRLANRTFTIVGVFAADGGAFESEIWTPRTMLADAYYRDFVSSVCLRLDSPQRAPEAIRYVNGPAVNLAARTETEYYEELASKTHDIVVLTTILVSIMAIGAAFAVANTMYSSVDARRREIATLRTLGFGRVAIMLAIVVESLLVCVLACSAGLLASMFFNGSRQDFLSDATWTVLAYEVQITPQIVAVALVTASVVGVIGALAPSIRAARTNILQAVRKG